MNEHPSISSPCLISAGHPQEMKMLTNPVLGEQYHLPEENGEQIDYIAHLLRLGQLLCTLNERHVEFLCQEIKAITHQQASLHFREQIAFSPHIFSLLPLQFNSFRYGYLAIIRHETNHEQPAIPLFSAHLMAQTISYILYMLEQHLLIQSLGRPTQYWSSIRLTRREQEVLSLICRGYTQDEIAEELALSLATVGTHRQHIYEQLGVHNEYDARIAAYHLGLFSFLVLGIKNDDAE